MTRKFNSKGFTVIVLVLVVVLLAAVGFGTWKILNDNKNQDSTNNTYQQTTDLYKGWKSYCDDKSKLCFKYPNNWAIDKEYSKENPLTVIITSNDGKARVMYASNYVRDGGDNKVVPVTLENSDNLNGFSIVGTYSLYFGEHRVWYDVIEGTIEQNDYKVGEPTNSLNNPRFDYNGVIHKFSGWALNGANNFPDFVNAKEAKQWFESEDANTVLLILKSLTAEED